MQASRLKGIKNWPDFIALTCDLFEIMVCYNIKKKKFKYLKPWGIKYQYFDWNHFGPTILVIINLW